MLETKDTPENQDVRAEINKIRAFVDMQMPRCVRNFARYSNILDQNLAMGSLLDIHYYNYFLAGMVDADLYSTYNLIASCTDTLTSKISQSKVRPFFNPVDASFRTRQACKAAQRFFDIYYDSQDVYGFMPEVIRDALLFQKGAIWINDDDWTMQRVPSYLVYVNPYEYACNSITKCFIRFPYASPSMIKKFITKADVSEYGNKVEICFYYDLEKKKKYYLVQGNVVKIKPIEFEIMPFEFLYWKRSIKGFFSSAAADDVYPIQIKVDELESIRHDANINSIKNLILTPKVKGSPALKISKLDTISGFGAEYEAPPGGQAPIEIITPPPISPMYDQQLNEYIQQAYNFYGISSLSAQSQKPQDVTAGIAFKTLQDIESERYNVFLHDVIDCYSKAARRFCDIAPKNAEILKDPRLGKYTWGDLKNSRDLYQIQFANSDFLSKDPSEKIKQIQQIAAMIPMTQGAMAAMMEFPDREKLFKVDSTSEDYCEKIIERAVLQGEIKYYPVVYLEGLKEKTMQYLMEMDINDSDPREMENLVKLYNAVLKQKDSAMKAVPVGQEPPPMPPVAPQPQAPADIGNLIPPPQSGAPLITPPEAGQ